MTGSSPPTDVIPRFFIGRGASISEYWRRNKSPLESQELANLLKALRAITAYIGPNTGEVIWSGMRSLNGESDILLSPAMVLGDYPIPGIRTDIAVGAVVTEAYRRTEWSDRMKYLLEKTVEDLHSQQVSRFEMYIDMAENIYLDTVSNKNVLGLYTELNRKKRVSQAQRKFTHPPSFGELIHIWWLMAADRSGTKYLEDYSREVYSVRGFNLEQYYTKPLRVLNSIVGRLIDDCVKIKSVVDRCEYRAGLYLSIWDELLDITKFWITDATDGRYISKVSDVGDIIDEETSRNALRSILAVVSGEIDLILQSNRDFTEEVRMLSGEDSEVVPVKLSDIVLPLEEPVDNELVQKIYLALKSYAKDRKQISRGLKSGKIDKRRLYRAPINDEIFYYKKTKPELDHDIILLIDATGSMGGPKWRAVQKIFAAMYTAVGNLNQNARVFAYNETRGTCFLTELAYNKKQLFTILPQGKTASGEAIIATALMLKSTARYRARQPFIIHLTDGSSNWGTEVKYAIDFCSKKKIKLMTLGFGCGKGNKAALREEYGSQVEFVDNINEIPGELGKLLTHTFHNYR